MRRQRTRCREGADRYNEFLENEVSELMRAVSHAYVRGRIKT
jgi:hypothetical protein